MTESDLSLDRHRNRAGRRGFLGTERARGGASAIAGRFEDDRIAGRIQLLKKLLRRRTGRSKA